MVQVNYTIPEIEGAVFRLAKFLRRTLPAAPKPLTNESELWREAVFCILSSQVSYTVALSATRRVSQRFDWVTASGSLEKRRDCLANLLSSPTEHVGRTHGYRYPNIAAHRIAQTLSVFHQYGYSWDNLLNATDDPRELRRMLVKTIAGFGPKQASMFLRNTGISWGLAILDRHVLSYMEYVGLLEPHVKAVVSLAYYEEIEHRLCAYSADRDLPVGILDFAIWVLMQEAKKT